jgi:hypothetical protein
MLHSKQTVKPIPHTLPHSFRRLRLELAREKGHPSGSSAHGYILIAPLDKEGRLDPETWHQYPDVCRVVRFRPGEADDIGHLVRKPGGSWAFHYDIAGDEPDERGFHFNAEHFTPGEYVSISEESGMHTFRVVSVEPV